MKRLRDDPSRVVILGAGSGGTAMLEMLSKEGLVDIVAVADHSANAPGMQLARKLGVAVYTDIEEALHASAPCVVFNLTGNEMVEAVASDILGTGAVIGGMEARLMWRMVTDLHEAKSKLEFQASHDELTGLYNRRHMVAELKRELPRVLRYQIPFSLALMDLDHFKVINDTQGHAAGDAVLKHVADLMGRQARSVDVIGRWGGEEFLVLLPHSEADDAKYAVEKWLEVVKREPVEVDMDISVDVSFSAGVATFKEVDASDDVEEMTDRLLARADERLYQAKHAGRGRVIGGA